MSKECIEKRLTEEQKLVTTAFLYCISYRHCFLLTCLNGESDLLLSDFEQ